MGLGKRLLAVGAVAVMLLSCAVRQQSGDPVDPGAAEQSAWVIYSATSGWNARESFELLITEDGRATLVQESGTERWRVPDVDLRWIEKGVAAFDFPNATQAAKAHPCPTVTDATTYRISARVGGRVYQLRHQKCIGSQFMCSVMALEYLIHTRSGAAEHTVVKPIYLPERFCDESYAE